MKSTFMLLLLLCGVCFVSNAQVILKGHVPDFSSRTISVFEYEDFFTSTRIERAVQKIDSLGNFSVSFALSNAQYLDLLLNKNYSGMYVQPGYTYEIVFDKKGKIQSIISEDKSNEVVKAHDDRDYALFRYQTKSSYLEKIKEFIQAEKKDISTLEPFVKNVLQYKLARRELYVYRKENDTAAINSLERNLLLKSVDNSSPWYFGLLKAFYSGKFNDFSTRKTAFNRNDVLNSFLRETKFVSNDTIQQLAFLTVLENGYQAEWGKPRNRIDQLADSIAVASVSVEVKRIATLLKRKNNSLKRGDQIEDFSFTTNVGNSFNLSSFSGKYVLIDFWYTGCSPCLENFPILKQLKESKLNLEIVSLTPNDSAERITAFLKKRSYDWYFAPVDKRGALIDYFNISYFPTYFLVDPQGKLIDQFDHAAFAKGFEEIAKLIK